MLTTVALTFQTICQT